MTATSEQEGGKMVLGKSTGLTPHEGRRGGGDDRAIEALRG